VRGSYRQVLQQIEMALQHYPDSGSLRLWQAITTEALGQTAAAIALTRPLLQHPDPEIAQQARYLVWIWEAPRLRRPPEWLSQIPDLTQLPESRELLPTSALRSRPATAQPASLPHNRPDPPEDLEPANPSQLDNRMIWIALGIVLLTTGIGVWIAELTGASG
jgi:hypothetical protein